VEILASAFAEFIGEGEADLQPVVVAGGDVGVRLMEPGDEGFDSVPAPQLVRRACSG